MSDEYDAYLNSVVRSIKAWRRGDELGGRLHAAASVYPLLRAVVGLERQMAAVSRSARDPSFELERLQGWPPGELRTQIVALLDRGSPDVQQRLQARVEALFLSRGIEHEWADDLEALKGWSNQV